MPPTRHAPPVPVTLVALANAATTASNFDELTPIYAMMPTFLNAVRQGRIDGDGHAESIYSIVETVEAACLKWTRTVHPHNNAYEDRQHLHAVLEAAGLEAEQEILAVWTPAAHAGFLTGLAYAYCALHPWEGGLGVVVRHTRKASSGVRGHWPRPADEGHAAAPANAPPR